MDEIANLINKYGFPIIAAVGMGNLIFYVWTWVTKEIKPLIKETETTIIALIDRVRMLDNDIIRLNQKVETVLQLKSKLIERSRLLRKMEEHNRFHSESDSE